MPGLYFGLEKKNPYFVSETVVCNDDCQRRLLAQLDVVKPELAFLDYQLGPPPRLRREQRRSTLTSAYTDLRCPNEGFQGLIVRAIDSTWCP